jgi:hypothetical protein
MAEEKIEVAEGKGNRPPYYMLRNTFIEAWLPKMKPETVKVLLALGMHLPNCRPGMKRIAQLSGVHMNTVRQAIDELCSFGIVEIEERPGKPNKYILHQPEVNDSFPESEHRHRRKKVNGSNPYHQKGVLDELLPTPEGGGTPTTRWGGYPYHQKGGEEEQEKKNKKEQLPPAVPFSPGGGPSLETQNPTQTNFSWKTFSTLYPDHRKGNGHMDRAEEAFGKLGSADRQQACLALAEWIESADWRREEGRYVPSPEKFLAERDRYWRRAAKSNHKREVEAMWQHFIDAGQLAKSVNKLTPDRRGHMQHRYEEAVAMRSEAEAMDVVRSAIDAYFADRRRQKDPGSANLDALFGTAEGFERWVKKGNA